MSYTIRQNCRRESYTDFLKRSDLDKRESLDTYRTTMWIRDNGGFPNMQNQPAEASWLCARILDRDEEQN